MANSRRMALTPELVALCYRQEADRGYWRPWKELDEAELGEIAAEVEASFDGAPIWTFAYGSLIWKPTFEATDHLRATAHGWHRSFCLELLGFRGTPEQPGLMMALERGGRCDGVAYRLPDRDRQGAIAGLIKRELLFREHLPMMRRIPVETVRGRLDAIVFWAGPTGEGIRSKLPLEEVARVLARACGHAGSGAEYLYNTVSHLEDMGIHDRNLWRLQELVADEIRALNGLAAPVD